MSGVVFHSVGAWVCVIVFRPVILVVCSSLSIVCVWFAKAVALLCFSMCFSSLCSVVLLWVSLGCGFIVISVQWSQLWFSDEAPKITR